MKDIYELKINEYTNLNEKVQVIRVPGGWIYNFREGGEVFVPYNNEFQ